MAFTNAQMAQAFGDELDLSPEQVEALETAFDQWAIGGARLATWSRLATDISLFNNAAVAMVHDWYGGTATGGPNGDGLYPLMNSDGEIFYVPSPARVAADLSGFEPKGQLEDEADLPSTGEPGDLWIVDGNAWGWNSRLGEWRNLGPFRGPQGPPIEIQKSATHVQWRVEGDDEWIDVVALSELAGADAEEISIRKSATHLQWRRGEGTWQDVVPLSELIGATPVISIGTVTTLAAGSPAAVTLRGTAAAPIIDFELPAGVTGNTGAVPNVSAAITMIAHGQPATVTRSGPDTAPVLTFAIPSPLDGTDGREIEVQTSATHAQWRYVGETVWQNWFELALLTGAKGDKGDAFAFDAKPANLAARDDYDDEPEGFTVLVMDTGTVYARIGPVPGVWSDGFPFGQTQNALLVALSELDSSTGVLVQTGAASFAKRAIGTGADAQILDRQSADGRYRQKTEAVAMADVTGLSGALSNKADAAAVLASLGAKADKSDTYTKAQVEEKIGDAIDALPAPPTVPGAASVAEVRAGTASGKYVSPAVLVDADGYVAVTASGAFTLDFSAGRKFKVTLTANSTMSITGLTKDVSGVIRFQQDATGSRTLGVSSAIKKVGTYTLSTAANAVDRCGVEICSGVVELTALENGIA